MDNMYGIIEQLCTERGITIGRLCAELKISRGIIGDLKAGRTKQLSAANIRKIADFFGVSIDYLLGEEKRPTPDNEGGLSNPVIAQIMDIVRQLPPETQLRSLEHFETLLALHKSAQAPDHRK